MPDSFPAVESESLLLIPDTVVDLDDFVSHPDQYLLSIDKEPQKAAALWAERLKKHPYGSEGLVRLSYYGHDLIDPALWDEVTGTWYALITCIHGYLGSGEGEGTLSGQPVSLTLRKVPAGAVFAVDGQATLVDPTQFVPGVLDGAAKYSQWVEEFVGVPEEPTYKQTVALKQAWNMGRHG